MSGLFKHHQEPQSLTPAFRKATQGDLPRIMEIFKASFEGQVPPKLYINYHFTFAQMIGDLGYHFNVASLGKKVVGFTIVDNKREPNAALLDVIGVDPAVQGQGLGKALLQEAEKAATNFNKPKLKLEVRENNATAIGFYKKQGYHSTGILPNAYWWDGVNGIAMEKQLAAQAQDNARKPARPSVINP